MQTRDVVEGLHKCFEFSQPSSCLHEAMLTPSACSFPVKGARLLFLTSVLIDQNYVPIVVILGCVPLGGDQDQDSKMCLDHSASNETMNP